MASGAEEVYDSESEMQWIADQFSPSWALPIE